MRPVSKNPFASAVGIKLMLTGDTAVYQDSQYLRFFWIQFEISFETTLIENSISQI